MKKIFSILAILFQFCLAQQKLSFSEYIGVGTNNPLYEFSLEGSEETGNPDKKAFLSLNHTTQYGR